MFKNPLFVLHHLRLPHYLTDKPMHPWILAHACTHTGAHSHNRCLLSGALRSEITGGRGRLQNSSVCTWVRGDLKLSPRSLWNTACLAVRNHICLSFLFLFFFCILQTACVRNAGALLSERGYSYIYLPFVAVFLFLQEVTACHPLWRLCKKQLETH